MCAIKDEETAMKESFALDMGFSPKSLVALDPVRCGYGPKFELYEQGWKACKLKMAGPLLAMVKQLNLD